MLYKVEERDFFEQPKFDFKLDWQAPQLPIINQ